MDADKKENKKITVVIVTEEGVYTFHQVVSVLVAEDKKLSFSAGQISPTIKAPK